MGYLTNLTTHHFRNHHHHTQLVPDRLGVLVHMNIVATLAVTGNIFLAYVICRGAKKTKHKISPVQVLLLHTCVADILFGIMALGTEVAIILCLPHFFGGPFVCKFTRYMQAFPMYASAFLLVAISADRYQAICRPLAHYRSDRYTRPNCLALVAWLLALACSLPQFWIWKIKHGQCSTIFNEHVYLRHAYVVYFGLVAWLLPSLIATVFYYFVCKTVWRSHGTIESTPSTMQPRMSFDTQDYIVRLRKRSLGLRNQCTEYDRKRIQTVRLTMTIIICNFCLWAPYCLMNVFYAFFPGTGETHGRIITYILILGNLNSCVNPWIYLLSIRKTKSQDSQSHAATSHNPTSHHAPAEHNGSSSSCSRHLRSRHSEPFVHFFSPNASRSHHHDHHNNSTHEHEHHSGHSARGDSDSGELHHSHYRPPTRGPPQRFHPNEMLAFSSSITLN